MMEFHPLNPIDALLLTDNKIPSAQTGWRLLGQALFVYVEPHLHGYGSNHIDAVQSTWMWF
jgi:hypothetical protein